MTTTATDSPTQPFAQVLRDRSKEMHSEAEGASFTATLLDGGVSRAGYVAMVVQHLHIYTALEAAADKLHDDAVAGPFITDQLTRVPALHADLEYLVGDDGLKATPLPSTERYVERIKEMEQWPGGYVAHHYTRYLGDLSGGFTIGKKVAQTFGFDWDDDGLGIQFYRFPMIERPKLFKDAYRAKLDAAPWDAAEQERVVDEVLRAYRHNTEVFAELAEAEGLS